MPSNQSMSMRLWLALLAHNEHVSVKATQVIIEFMRNWLQEVNDNSATGGYHACLIDVAIDNLDDEIKAVRKRVTNQAVMRRPPDAFHKLED